MSSRNLLVALLAVGLMAGGAGLLVRLRNSQRLGEPGLRVMAEEGSSRVRIVLPERVLDFGSTNIEPTETELAFLPKDTSFAKRLYAAPDGFQAAVNVVLMGTDRTSIHKPEYCLTSQGWRILGRETTSLRIPRPHPYDLPVRRFTLGSTEAPPAEAPGRRYGVFVFWFVADAKVTASHLGRMGHITWDLLRTGVLPRWAYVSAFSTCALGDEDATYDRLQAFLQAAVPEFQTAVLPPASGPSQAAAVR